MNQANIWLLPPQSLELTTDEVHIWRISLVIPKEQEDQLWLTLSSDEQTRANRFHFPQHRSEFIAARGILRYLLGQYLDQSPESIQFTYGKQAKPSLKPPSSLTFNISHSHSLALFAFGHQMELGVDLEKIQPEIDIIQLSENFFSKNEKNTILNLSGVAQIRGFFNCWTRKEAFIKAKGKGLSLPLDQFEVSILPEEPVRLLVTQWDPEESKKWFISPLFPGNSYVGALALNKKIKSFKYWKFSSFILR